MVTGEVKIQEAVNERIKRRAGLGKQVRLSRRRGRPEEWYLGMSSDARKQERYKRQLTGGWVCSQDR